MGVLVSGSRWSGRETIHSGGFRRGEKAAYYANAKHKNPSRRLLARGGCGRRARRHGTAVLFFFVNCFRAFSPLRGVLVGGDVSF